MTARSQALARQEQQIEESTARAAAARPRNALEAMASRLRVTPGALKSSLMKTVFKECRSDDEFVALVVVANEFGLNPLLKEIYAFPTKGGGITPMVSIDGWIRLMNEHPQFDGIEFIYTPDEKGGIEAIEAVIYRKDRNHPIKVIEYLEECKRNTDPWNKSPRRMLRHRALIQCVRVAFGFSGVAAEGEEDEFANVPVYDAGPAVLPSQKSLAEDLGDEIPKFDKETGEVFETDPATGMSVVDEDTARELDAQADEALRNIDGTLEQQEAPAWKPLVDGLIQAIRTAGNKAALKKAEEEYLKHAAALPKEASDPIEVEIRAARQRLNGEG
jgi:phage recombination protein Bet